MSLNTTPRTWVTGEVVTAAELNTEVRDALTGIQSAWTAYTPALTNITLGNGTLAFKFQRYGKTIFFRGQFQAGSTTTYASGTLAIALPPVAPHADYTSVGGYAVGTAVAQPGVTSSRVGCTLVVTVSSTVNLLIDNASANVVATNLLPATWGTSAMISMTGSYQAA